MMHSSTFQRRNIFKPCYKIIYNALLVFHHPGNIQFPQICDCSFGSTTIGIKKQKGSTKMRN